MKTPFSLLLILILVTSCNKEKSEKENVAPAAYSIVWRYRINPEHREKYELEYGARGQWVELFSKSKDYGGSFLHKSEDDPDIYLLIDTWHSKDAYNRFKEERKSTYDSLSAIFETLYKTEEKVGEFTRVD